MDPLATHRFSPQAQANSAPAVARRELDLGVIVMVFRVGF